MAAMTLLAGAGLFVESFVNLQRVNLGFQPDGLLTASLVPPRARYPSRDAVRELIDAAVTRAAAIPGAADAAFTTMLPLSGGQIMFSFRIYGRPPAANPRDAPVGAYRAVSTNYFETMGMTITSGRAFTPDDRPGGAAVAVVNEAMVQKYWPGESPVGARIGLNGVETTVVGVVGDVHHKGPGIAPDAEMFVPYGQASVRQGWIVVRTTAEPASLGGALRAAVRDADPNLPLASVRTMASRAADATAEPRFLATLLSSFSLVAVALALVGVYGLLSFTVTQRAREIGVRMAVGATAASVMRMVLVESVLVSAAGAAAGAVCAAWLSRLVRAQLFGVAPGDPTTLFLLFAALLAAAAAASLRPARRAATIDPVVAMRNDHLRSE
jgi:putative ABC transport system permease protein